ncbi:hypothetical protein RLOC_00001477 [Lonchura striata]|uniref:Uncharacterized protein n=1 Tax=Lonchura striata TaxID=40157 RepID=A0A218UBY0_9PASE|nr:hypothetical protein RLOC_00001477 [Lonchura striata domestica]
MGAAGTSTSCCATSSTSSLRSR